MNETKAIFGFLSFFAMLCGVGLLLVKVEKNEIQKVSKLMPMASLFQYQWFKYFVVLVCIILSAIAALQIFGI